MRNYGYMHKIYVMSILSKQIWCWTYGCISYRHGQTKDV